MSGIGGILHFDDRAVNRDALGRFIDVCAHRGPHGRGVWADGSVGLGQRLLRPGDDEPTRPRELDLYRDGVAVVADARLDNRDELEAALGPPTTHDTELACNELIRAAYLEWGDRCAEHLLGDFAFGIWDTRRERLFCARDHFGVRPFYYGFNHRGLAFASEIKAILALGELPRRVNETRVAEYLASIILDNATTFFEGIFRLPPGHALVVEGSDAVVSRYWALERVETPRGGPIEDEVERFRKVLYEAVRCRLPANRPVGVLLSGGLDSSAIAAVMTELLATHKPPRLHAFSAAFETVTECDESDYVRAVLGKGGVVGHTTHGDRIGPFSDIEAMSRHHDEPYEAPNLFMVWALYAHARRNGISTLLDGYDGDTTLSHGVGHLHELAGAGRWLALAIQLRGLAQIDGTSWLRAFWRFWRFHAVRPLLAGSPWNLPGRSYHRARRSLGLPVAASSAREDVIDANSHINPGLARRTRLDDRYRQWLEASPGRARSGAEEHYRAITGCIQPFALEVYDRTAAAFSLANPHPFWDKRLVELSLGLPAELKLDRGWSRMVLRRAMRHALPEKVVWRRSKVDFAHNVRNALTSVDGDPVERLVQGHDLEIAASYVDVARVREAHRRLQLSGDESWRRDLFAVWKVVSLILWLRRDDPSPS